MREMNFTANAVVQALLRQVGRENVCVLDSCGVGRPGSDLLIAGFDPVEVLRLTHDDPAETLAAFQDRLQAEELAAIFTVSYDLGLKLNGMKTKWPQNEPDIFVALFDRLIVHEYDARKTFVAGRADKFEELEALFACHTTSSTRSHRPTRSHAVPRPSVTRREYMDSVEEIKELIRSGETYQANLTQQFQVPVADAPHHIFLRLREDHPAPFAAFLDRGDSAVVSASPELFIRIEAAPNGRVITASPIKGTLRRGHTVDEDRRLKNELSASQKDRAENTMIVDLMRNDLGRICEFGSVAVDELYRVDEHPTLFHLVSTVTGRLQEDVGYADMLKAVFPCGSITGAPKIRTMEIIDRLEPQTRGLSMGAIGCRAPAGWLGEGEVFEMSVAIRTMVVRDGTAVFNVGGGIVIDSDAAKEYGESTLKAKALFNALGVKNAGPNGGESG